MTDNVSVEDVDVPTFSDCVVGYRAWLLDDEGQLWPLRGHGRAWVPGVNTARCECGASDRLHFEWNWVDGKRVLEPAQLHDAPGESCACGLYSIRQPRQWSTDAAFAEGNKVAGAVRRGVGCRSTQPACELSMRAWSRSLILTVRPR